jgi:hypothetical protein
MAFKGMNRHFYSLARSGETAYKRGAPPEQRHEAFMLLADTKSLELLRVLLNSADIVDFEYL